MELCAPAHMLVLMLEECKKKGFEMRADVEHSLNMAAVSPMAKAKLDPVRPAGWPRRSTSWRPACCTP